jgi:hypothetical protein
LARKYYYPGEKTGVAARVRNRLFRKPVPDFPKTVVIETQFGCNGACVFCQYPQLKDVLPRGRMSLSLFEKIARDCAGRDVERFILCLDNEPLLDPEISAKFALLREHCPAAARNLTTNASLLTPEKIEALIGSGLVTELFLSVNGASKEVYEKLMGLPFEQTMRNLDGFCAWLRAHPKIKARLRVRVNTVKTQLVAPEIPALKARWEPEGFELHVIDMDNRGNQLDLRRALPEKMKPNRACRRPFHTMVITWDGEAVLCCVDYRRTVRLGSVTAQSLADVWNGPRATQLRKEHLAGDFTHLPICAVCTINR